MPRLDNSKYRVPGSLHKGSLRITKSKARSAPALSGRMTKIEEVAEKIYRLEARLPLVGRVVSVYLIREREGVLIDPGPASVVPFILRGMRRLAMQKLSYVIPTHIHLDQGGGMGKLAELFPEALVVLHPRGARHVVDPSRLIQATRAIHGDDFEVHYGPILPVPESQVKVPEDGEVITVDGRELQVVYTPGHAPHHVVVFDKKTHGLFCGQAAGVSSPVADSFPLPSAAPPDFDLDSYLATIERVKRLKPQLLFYPHGGVGREPEKLISMLMKNTLMFRDVTLKALREDKTPEVIARRVREHAAAHLGLDLRNVGIEMMVLGYIAHFAKKGMV